MKRRLIGFALMAIMLFAGTSASADFVDVIGSEWFADAVQFVSERKYFNGVSDDEFAPDESMTRGMFVTVLGRLAGVDRSEYTRDKFPDVQFDDWYYTYVTWAAENGITDGYPDGSFHPNDPVNREQIAVMLNRYLISMDIELDTNPNAAAAYTDEDAVSQWARAGVSLMRETAIFTGDQYGHFHPERYGTRAEIANVIMRLWSAMNGEVLNVPTATPMPTAEPISPELEKVNQILSGMTLNDKIYQMFMVTPEQLTGVMPVTVAGEVTKAALASHPVGGLLYSKQNITSDYQFYRMLDATRSYAKTALFIATTEECGALSQMSSVFAMPEWNYMYDYRDDGADKAYEIGTSIGEKMYQHGFNMNFAPVADVWSNARNSFIGERSFSSSPQIAGEMAAAEVRGLQSRGISAVLKHFPGIGDTTVDGNGRLISKKTWNQFFASELVPFQHGIGSGVDFILCSHVTAESVDSYPASMSGVFIGSILRNQLGFNGVIITDSLDSPAITNFYSTADAAVNCVMAGADMLLSPGGIDSAADGILKAVAEGKISEERINESVRRILQVKLNRGIIAY